MMTFIPLQTRLTTLVSAMINNRMTMGQFLVQRLYMTYIQSTGAVLGYKLLQFGISNPRRSARFSISSVFHNHSVNTTLGRITRIEYYYKYIIPSSNKLYLWLLQLDEPWCEWNYLIRCVNSILIVTKLGLTALPLRRIYL